MSGTILHRLIGNEPKCPACKNENAMLRFGLWYEYNYACRD